MSVESCKI